MKPITLVTGSPNKHREAQEILGDNIVQVDIDLDEIQSLDTVKVATAKVKAAYKQVQAPVFVWDTALHFVGLNNFPGPLIKWFWHSLPADKICKLVHGTGNTKAIATTVLAYHDGVGITTFDSSVVGQVPKDPVKNNGWGWDSVFVPDGLEGSYSDMSAKELTTVHPHTKALSAFADYLKNNDKQ